MVVLTSDNDGDEVALVDIKRKLSLSFSLELK